MDSLFFDHGTTEFREMMSNRRFSTFSAWLACGLLLLTSSSAVGQDRLDAGVLGNDSFWSPAERQAIEGFVDRQLAAIQSGEEEAINLGRNGLTDPTRAPGVTDRFIEQFAGLIAGKLSPLMDSTSLKVRLNAMVVGMSLPHPDAVGAIENGLDDPSAGVRYPAARAMEGLIASGQLSAAQTQAALGNIQRLIVTENDMHVVQPLFEAMLAAPDNNGQVLEVLNARLSRHVDQPEASFAPESTALQAVYSRLITAQQRSRADVRELARASTRHMLLSAQQLASGEVPEANGAGHLDVIRVAAVALEFAHGELQSRELAPPSPARNLAQSNWESIVRIGEGWVNVLKAEPFNYADTDLNIEAARAAVE